MPAFNPLQQLRIIRDDKTLTPMQQHILMAACLRTDNTSGQVRYSQELLAHDANVGVRTVERALRHPSVRRYFVMEREGRRLNLIWRKPVTESAIPVTESKNTRHSDGPSTRASTSTSTRAGAPKRDAPLGGTTRRKPVLTKDLRRDVIAEGILCPDCMWFLDACACGE